MVQFQVKTDSDACILLPPCDGCDGYEVVIGGWDNTQSVIRDKMGKPHPGYAVTQVGCRIEFGIIFNGCIIYDISSLL